MKSKINRMLYATVKFYFALPNLLQLPGIATYQPWSIMKHLPLW